MDRPRLAAVVSLLMVSWLVAGADTRQVQQPLPTFRANVDVITVDVSVLGRDGRPIPGLTAQDFAVTVDGQARRVVSAEYISRSSGGRADALPDDPAITNNRSLPPGQQVLLVLDMGGTSAGARDAVLAAAYHLLQGLAASDSIALATVPRSTTAVEFTTNRALVRERLSRAGGWTSPPLLNQPFTVIEALACGGADLDRSDCTRATARVCAGLRDPVDREQCALQLHSTMAAVIVELRARAATSFDGLASLVGALDAVEGPKTLVLFSEALLLSGATSELDRIARLAAQARVRIHVLRPIQPTGGSSEGVVRPAGFADQHLLGEPLEVVAGRTGGRVLSLAANPRAASEALIGELSGYYLLGVESEPGDRDGEAHALRVRASRPGVSVRARAEFVAPANPLPRTVEEMVAAAIRDPVGRPAVPLAVRTYRVPESASATRLIIAADLGSTESRATAVGFALLNDAGLVAASGFDESIPGAEYLRSVVVATGDYDLKLAVVDDARQSGSVRHYAPAGLRRVGPFLAGDVIVAAAGANGELRPPVHRGIRASAIGVAVLLLAEDRAAAGDSEITIEIARDGEASPSVTAPARYATRSDRPGIFAAQATIPVAELLPGAYLVSAVVRQDGREVGRLADRFTLLRSEAPPTTSAAPAPDSVRRRPAPEGPRVWLALDPLHAAPRSEQSNRALEALREALDRGGFAAAASPREAAVRIELSGQRLLGAGRGALPRRMRGSRELVLMRATASRGQDVAEVRGRSSTSDDPWGSAAAETVRGIARWLREREPTTSASPLEFVLEDTGLSRAPTNKTELLQRLREYVGRYQESASAIVAEERYIQEYWRRRFPYPAPLHAIRRELRSEMGFTFFATAGIWFGFRDVLEVDGAPVPHRDQESRQLFLDGRVPSGEQFRRVAEASARFNIGPGQRNLNVPMMTLLFASPEHFERCRFEILQVERLEGVETAVVAFTETARPTLITRHGHDRPARGLLWVDTSTGRIRQTELSVREEELDARLTTWYAFDEYAKMMMPTRMREIYDYVERVDEYVETLATYTNFRRFQTTTRVVP